MNREMTMRRYRQIRIARDRIKKIRRMMREPEGHNVWSTNPRLAHEEILFHITVITSCRNSLKAER